jgi:hypothetical protein
MKPTEWRDDGWPFCPVCGEDELAVLEMPPDLADQGPPIWYFEREMFCYRCARVTVLAGEAR